MWGDGGKMKAPSKTQEDITELIPINEIPEIVGKLFYSESDQAWSTIRFKKEILQKFPQLKEKRGSFCYKMKLFSSQDELNDEIKSLRKNPAIIPMLLFLCKRRVEEN